MPPRNAPGRRRLKPKTRPVSRSEKIRRQNSTRQNRQATLDRRALRRQAIAAREAEMKKKQEAKKKAAVGRKAPAAKPKRPVAARPKRLPNARQRLNKFGKGVRSVNARVMRVAKPVAKRNAVKLGKWGMQKMGQLATGTIHYGGVFFKKAGKPVLATGGEWLGEGWESGVGALRSAGTATLHGLGEAGSRAGANLAEKGTSLLGDAAVGTINLGDRGIRATAKGIGATARVGGKAVKGLTYSLPKATAKRLLNYFGSKRALKRMLDPNLAGNWKLLYRQEGIPVTRDGFVVHTIKSRPYRYARGKKASILVNIEYGFSEKGRLAIRAEPVLSANPEENEIIHSIYNKRFHNVKTGVRSLTRRLGGKRGIKELSERAISEAAFPEEPYAGPESMAAEARGLVPENAALTEAEIETAMQEARESRQQQEAGARQ